VLRLRFRWSPVAAALIRLGVELVIEAYERNPQQDGRCSRDKPKNVEETVDRRAGQQCGSGALPVRRAWAAARRRDARVPPKSRRGDLARYRTSAVRCAGRA